MGNDCKCKPDSVTHILQKAAANGLDDLAKAAILAGADINKTFCSTGLTPLMLAVRSGNKDIVELLVRAGADKMIKSMEGDTALDIAKKMGFNEIAELLTY